MDGIINPPLRENETIKKKQYVVSGEDFRKIKEIVGNINSNEFNFRNGNLNDSNYYLGKSFVENDRIAEVLDRIEQEN